MGTHAGFSGLVLSSPLPPLSCTVSGQNQIRLGLSTPLDLTMALSCFLSFSFFLTFVQTQVCMPLGHDWAYNPHDVYKTTKTVIQTLVSVVATGGSLLLDIGPSSTN